MRSHFTFPLRYAFPLTVCSGIDGEAEMQMQLFMGIVGEGRGVQ
jgi:hypothetical protein